MNAGKGKYIFAIVLGLSLLCSQLVFAVQPSISILGDVVGSGKTEMKTAFDRWIPISGKTFPVIDGANLRSGDGIMSLIFRDSARMDVGKNSDVIVTGARGNYAIDVKIGQIAFAVPKGISFSVKTPTSTIQTQASTDLIRKVSFSSQDDVKGVVTYDGKGTRITAINGTLVVKSGLGVKLQTLSAGDAIYIARKDTGNIIKVQPVEDDNKGGGAAGAPGEGGAAGGGNAPGAGGGPDKWENAGVVAGGTGWVVGWYGITRLVSAWH